VSVLHHGVLLQLWQQRCISTIQWKTLKILCHWVVMTTTMTRNVDRRTQDWVDFNQDLSVFVNARQTLGTERSVCTVSQNRPHLVFTRNLAKLWRILINFCPQISRLLSIKCTHNFPGRHIFTYFIVIIYRELALITRPPDGVLLAPLALAARRLRRLASLRELQSFVLFGRCRLRRRPDVVWASFARCCFPGVSYFCQSRTHTWMTLTLTLPETLPGWTWVRVSSLVSIGPAVWPAIRNKQTDITPFII